MKGDRLLISPHHTDRARELRERILPRLGDRTVISVAGESGAGKSELGAEIGRALEESGLSCQVLQQDDYFVFPPKTNHEMRRKNLEQVGLYEVKLGLLDSNLRSFKRGETPIYRPLVDYDADRIEFDELDLSAVDVVIAEGTYTTSLRFVDLRVFIARTFADTTEHRRERGRDRMEPFVEEVLRREHEIIREHRALADFVVSADFGSIADEEGEG